MKKLYRKSSIHPSPPLVSDKLAFLPAAILAITAALSPDDQEALAYLISCSSSSSGNFSSSNRTTTSSSDCADHPPSFNCYCFNCYMSYWVKWDSSPNRQLIHQVIDAYEDGLQGKSEKSRGKKRRKNNNKDKKSEVVVLNVEDSGEPNTAEESPISGGGGGGDEEEEEEEEEEDGYGEERGAVRRFVSFLGERIWGVWA